jgi:toxin YoeB
MNVYFTDIANKELKNWLKADRSTAKKIYDLISDIQKYGMLGGRGKPEQLKHYKNPVRFSRQINKGDRLVYSPQDKKDLLIISCKGHYDDK